MVLEVPYCLRAKLRCVSEAKGVERKGWGEGKAKMELGESKEGGARGKKGWG